MKNRPLEAIGKLSKHDHICLIYETRFEQFDSAVPFIRIGLENGEKCIYIADDSTANEILSAMRSGGIDVESALSKGALVIVSKKETYLRQGYFDPDEMIRFLKESTDSTKKEGFSGLRVTGEMTWVLGGEAGTSKLMEYESKLNLFFPENDCLALCQYNRNRFIPEILADVIHTHPLVIAGGFVCKNFYYIPPEEFLKKDKKSLEVERLLFNLIDREKAQEALRQSEEKFFKAFHATPDAIVITRISDNRLIDVNEVFVRFSGYSRDEAVGHTSLEFNLWANPQDRERYFTTLRVKGSVREQEAQFRMKSGEILDGLVSGETFGMDEEMYILTIIRNITERKKVEQMLQISKEIFLKAFRSSPIALTLARVDDGILVEANHAFEDTTGYSLEEAIGKTVRELNLFLDMREREVLVEMLKNKRQMRNIEMHLRHKSGEPRIVQCSAELITIGKSEYIISTMEDITKRKLIEKELQESEESLKKAQELGKIGNWEFDLKTQKINWSDEVYVLYERDKKLGPPSPEEEAQYYPSEVAKKLNELSRMAMETGKEFRYDLTARLPSGRIALFNTSINPVKDEFGTVIRLLGTVQEITERKLMEEAMLKSEKSMREAQRLAHIGSWQWTMATDTVKWSEELYHINGLDPNSSAPGFAKMSSCYTPESWKRLSAVVAKALQSGEAYELDLDIVRPDGTTIPTYARGEADYDASGRIIGLHGTVQDITQRKRAEEEILKSKLLLNETQRISRVGGWEYDVEKKIVKWTDEVYNIYEVTNDFDPNNIDKAIEFYYPEDRNLIRNAFDKAVNQGEPYDLELKFSSAKGQPLWIRTIGKPSMQDGKIKRVIGNIMDITQRKQAEEELKKHRDHLEELVKERTEELENKNKDLEIMIKGLVGRELRMIELKNMIEDLETKLGQQHEK